VRKLRRRQPSRLLEPSPPQQFQHPSIQNRGIRSRSSRTAQCAAGSPAGAIARREPVRKKQPATPPRRMFTQPTERRIEQCKHSRLHVMQRSFWLAASCRRLNATAFRYRKSSGRSSTFPRPPGLCPTSRRSTRSLTVITIRARSNGKLPVSSATFKERKHQIKGTGMKPYSFSAAKITTILVLMDSTGSIRPRGDLVKLVLPALVIVFAFVAAVVFFADRR
jgi:hypothetical protein